MSLDPLWAYALSLAAGAGLAGGALRARLTGLGRRNAEVEDLLRRRTRELEQALVSTREAVQRAETLRSATEMLTRSLDLRELLQLTLTELRKVVAYDSASVQELDGQTLRIIAGVGFPNLDEIVGLTFDVGDKRSPNGAVVRQRAPRILTDTSEYSVFRSDVHAPAAIRSWLGVPLISGDRLLGLVTLDKKDPGFYTQEHARLALAFAAQAAVAIQNARLFERERRHAEEAERHAAEREQAALALRDSEERIRAVLETAHDAFISMDATGVITGWNVQAEAMFGWTHAEVVGRRVADTIVPEHREAHVRGLERFLATGQGRVMERPVELAALHRAGHQFPVELTISAVRSPEGPTFTAFVRDITRRRWVEQRTRAQHAATRVLAESLTLAEASPKLLEAICESLGWVFGAIWFVDASKDRLICAQTWHRPSVEVAEFEALTRRTTFVRGVGLPGRIWASSQPAWIPDVVQDANFPRAPAAARDGLHGAFGFPILSRGTPIGVLEFFSPEIQKPDEDLLAMMASVGSQLGQYVERKRTEEELRESETRYRQLVEEATDIIYRTDANGFFTYVNPVGLRISGYSDGEVPGRHFLELISPEYRDQAASVYMEQWLQKVPSTYYEFPMVTKDGRELWIGQNVQIVGTDETITGGFQAVARDITARRQAEEAVEKERRQLREIVANAPVAMAILDHEGRFVAHSERWLRHWQLEEDETLIGRAHDDVLPKIGGTYQDGLRQALAGHVVARPEDLLEVPGRGRSYVSWTMHPWRGKDDAVEGVVIVVQYIDLLVKARLAAEEASRMKSVFVASMSHELRTPLNAILGFVQLMQRRRGRDPEDCEHLGVIGRSGEHLLGLINDVLSLAKIEAGQMSLSVADFDLCAVLTSLQKLFEPRAAAKGLAFEVEVPADLPRFVTGDEGKVRQILMNLLGNAFKFTARGHVFLRARGQDGRVRFEVEDTGPGIAAEEVGRLFVAFSQAEAGRRRADGTGLGLTLSRSFARLMQGDVTLTSAPGRGSVFRVDVALPLSTSPVEAAPRPRMVRELVPGPTREILVTDDDDDSRNLLVSLLRWVGFEVRAATDGKAAVEEWRRARPDLIFMDINMPLLDGIAATKAIRAEEAAGEGPRTPIVAVSASAFAHERQSVLAAGCDGFLAKPFHEGELFDLLAERLGVSYVTDEIETASSPALPDESALAPQRMALLPEGWRSRFRQALARADADEALGLTGEIAEADPALARALAARLKAFRLDELEELLG